MSSFKVLSEISNARIIEFGPVPPEEIEDARKTWPDPPARKGKSRRSA
jgi:hypothetical protein